MQHLPMSAFERVWQDSPVAVLVTGGTDHELIYQNQCCIELLGQLPLGTPLQRLLPQMTSVGLDRLNSVLRTGETLRTDAHWLPITDVQGRPIAMRYVMAPLGGPRGHLGARHVERKMGVSGAASCGRFADVFDGDRRASRGPPLVRPVIGGLDGPEGRASGDPEVDGSASLCVYASGAGVRSPCAGAGSCPSGPGSRPSNACSDVARHWVDGWWIGTRA